jgi:hypothetical protein
MNIYEVEFLVKERRQKIENEFRKIHLMQSIQAGKSPWQEKWILRLADFLIGVGLYLKDHYRTACCNQSSSLRA